MFTFPALLWFLPLAGLVVLIHLINMFRHRPVPWAAMEFLLAGYRKSRTRILLQQLLLMLLRTLAVVALVLLLAGPKFAGLFAKLFDPRPTHHLVLLDDSYSMSDRNTAQGGHSVFEDALATVREIAATALRRGGADRFTLIPASRARKIALGEEPDFAERAIDPESVTALGELLDATEVSESAAGPEELLNATKRLITESGSASRPVVYLLSDFRTRDWQRPEPLGKLCKEIKELGGTVRAVRMVDQARPNLALRQVRPVEGIQAAEIELLLDASPVNYGTTLIEGVPLSITIDGRPQPGQVLPPLKPGDTTASPLRFPVRFSEGGVHRVQVRLAPDAVATDNSRSFVLDVPEAVDVLLIAPENEQATAEMVRSAIAPGDVRSGVRVRVEPPRFLSTATLDYFRTILLIDVPPLDAAAIRSLDAYIRSGGGVAFFLGPNTDNRFFGGELYRDGTGFFPLKPLGVATLTPDYLSKAADLTFANHPAFRLFGEGESPLLATVKINRYIDSDASIPDSEERRVLARLRTGAPLIVERSYGKGSCIAFTTTVSTEWNSWARSGSFVVTLLDLVAYLSRRRGGEEAYPLDAAIPFTFDSSVYELAVQITPPAPEHPGAVPPQPTTLEAVLEPDGSARLEFTDTRRAGIYEMTLTRRDGTTETRFFAVNVDPAEGDIRLLDIDELADLLQRFDVRLESAASFSAPLEFTGARSLTDAMLLLLVLLLAGEMFLAGRILPPSKGRSAGLLKKQQPERSVAK